MKFLDLNEKAFGMDFSDLSVRVANLRRRGAFFKLDSWGEAHLNPGSIVDGEIKNEDEVVLAILQALKNVKGRKISIKNVIASLPERKSFLVIIKMPKMKEEELKTAVYFEAENHIPFQLNDVYLDFERVASDDNSGKEINVLIAATPKKIADSYVSCLKKSGLFPVALEVESRAIIRAIGSRKTGSLPILIIDFGHTRTSFILFANQSIQFTSSVPISSFMVTNAISKNLNVSLKEAEKLKINYGILSEKSKKAAEAKKIFEASVPIIADLSEQALKSISYYESHDTKKVEKVLLSGGGSNLKGLADFISFNLKIPVELANPWVNILPAPLKEVPGLAFKESLGYSTVLGLALRGVNFFKEQ